MILAALILAGVMAYGAIAGVCHVLIVSKYNDPDHRSGHIGDAEFLAPAMWPVAFLPVYIAAWYEVDRNRKAREQKEKDELLKKEGLL